jgi:hypothetical protein
MKREEILANCIEEIRSGKSTIEDCVSRYPKFGKEIRSLLEITTGLMPEKTNPSLEFKERARRRLLEEMQPKLAESSHGFWPWRELVPVRVLVSVLVVILVLGTAGGSTVYASQSSLPGDILYSVKTGAENIQLALTPGATAKSSLHLKFAQRRVDEMAQEVKLNKPITIQNLGRIEGQYDDAIKELNNSNNIEAIERVLSRMSEDSLNQQFELEESLANAPEADRSTLRKALGLTRRGNIIAQAAYTNHDFLQSRPSVSNEKLEASQFNIDGTLLSVNDDTWNLGGVILKNVHCPIKVPDIGSRIKLEGLVKDDEVFISRIEIVESSQTTTKVEGQFGGISDDGKSNIGGISVNIDAKGGPKLEPGDNVQLQSSDDDDTLKVVNREEDDDDRDNTRISGTLMAVDTTKGTIILKTAGNTITINVKEARIENDSEKAITLSDLNHFIKKDINVDGLYKKNNIIFAERVRIEEED